MRYVHLGLITALTVVVAACNSSDKPGSDNGALAGGGTTKVVLGPYDYELTGKNDDGKACSTGVKKFETLHLMCINIQDPVQNNNCAPSERISKFIQDCDPKGYDFFESHQCRVSLLDKAADVSVFGEYDKKHLVESVDYCAGRTPGGMDMDGVYLDGWLQYQDKIALSVAMNFVPRKDAYADHRSSFKLMLRKQKPNGERIDLIDEYNYDNGGSVQSGTLRDGSYKYIIQCGNTWACTGSSQ